MNAIPDKPLPLLVDADEFNAALAEFKAALRDEQEVRARMLSAQDRILAVLVAGVKSWPTNNREEKT